MLITRMKLRCILAIFFSIGSPAAITGEQEPYDSKLEVSPASPFYGLPSVPGPNVEKIMSMRQNSWLELGPPEPDPVCGSAKGRAWGSKMPFAPDWRGAFLYGEGEHGGVTERNGKTHYNDDLFFYDINTHRWICIYPGTEVGSYNLIINSEGFEADKEGNPVPVAPLVHSYAMLTYDPRRQTMWHMSSPSNYWRKWFPERVAQLKESAEFLNGYGRRTSKTNKASPWGYSTTRGGWVRHKTIMDSPSKIGHGAHLIYLPPNDKLFFLGKSGTYLYGPQENRWEKLTPMGPRPPRPRDAPSCYDEKRNRIYLGMGSYGGGTTVKGNDNRLWGYDVSANAWLDLHPGGDLIPPQVKHPQGINASLLHCNSQEDIVLYLSREYDRGRGIYFYSPEKNEWLLRDPVELPKSWGKRRPHGFYDPELNVHFFFVASDSKDDGSMFVYRSGVITRQNQPEQRVKVSENAYSDNPITASTSEVMRPQKATGSKESAEIVTAVDDSYGRKWRGKKVRSNDLGSVSAASSKLVSGPTVGKIVLSNSGTFKFSHDSQYCGPVSFKYRLKRGDYYSNVANVDFVYCPSEEPVVAVSPSPKRGSSAIARSPKPYSHDCGYDYIGVDCLEPVVTFKPDFPPLGKYSVQGACGASIQEGLPSVTLQDRERISDALVRLKALSPTGGTLYIPWNVDTLQCDTLTVGKRAFMTQFKAHGISGPNGELPRFYCRSHKRDGTIPHGVKRFASMGRYLNKKSPPPDAMYIVENLHIDGYASSAMAPNRGTFILRNNYMHHAYGNGVKGQNVAGRLEVCGNTISHSGLGNYKHALYLAGGGTSVFVDNKIDSCGFSSCYKSTVATNLISGNEFTNTKITDPSYSKRYSGMLIDSVACSHNVVENNIIETYVDKKGSWAIPVGIRNRKRMFGCNKPPGWTEVAGGGLEKVDSEFWDPAYWTGLNGEKIFRSIIRKNTFKRTGPLPTDKAKAVVSWGTYPNKRAKAFGPSCLLAPPLGWFERSRVYMSGNTYIGGYSAKSAYTESVPGHNERLCGYPMPEIDLRDDDLIEVGPGESYQ